MLDKYLFLNNLTRNEENKTLVDMTLEFYDLANEYIEKEMTIHWLVARMIGEQIIYLAEHKYIKNLKAILKNLCKYAKEQDFSNAQIVMYTYDTAKILAKYTLM